MEHVRDSKEFLELAQRAVARKARRLAGRSGLTKSDVEDIQQELFATLWARMERFDPAKLALKKFIRKVLSQAVKSMLRYRQRKRRDYRRTELTLNEEVRDAKEGITCERVALLTVEQYGKLRLGVERRREDRLRELRVDMEAVMARLPAGLRELAERLKHKNPTDVAEELGLPRGTLYERMAELRACFERAGFSPDF